MLMRYQATLFSDTECTAIAMLQADATEHIKAVIDRIKPEYLVRFCPLKFMSICFVPFVVHRDNVRVSGAFVQSKQCGCAFL